MNNKFYCGIDISKRKFDERKTDEKHIHDQDLYLNKFNIDGNPYNVEFAFDYLKDNDEFRYAGHKVINNIKIAASPTQAFNAIQTAAAIDNIIIDFFKYFNLFIENKIEPEEWITVKGKGQTSEEIPPENAKEVIEEAGRSGIA